MTNLFGKNRQEEVSCEGWNTIALIDRRMFEKRQGEDAESRSAVPLQVSREGPWMNCSTVGRGNL